MAARLAQLCRTDAAAGKRAGLFAQYAMNAVHNDGALPSQVLALTHVSRTSLRFAQAWQAADERDQQALDAGSPRTGTGILKKMDSVKTIHSLCSDLLREHQSLIPNLGRTRGFSLWNEKDVTLPLERLLQEHSEFVTMKNLQRTIRRMKVLSAISTEPASPAHYETLLNTYNNSLQSNNAFDFDDLIVLGHKLLQTAPPGHLPMVDQVKYVFVDALEDSYPITSSLLDLLLTRIKPTSVYVTYEPNFGKFYLPEVLQKQEVLLAKFASMGSLTSLPPTQPSAISDSIHLHDIVSTVNRTLPSGGRVQFAPVANIRDEATLIAGQFAYKQELVRDACVLIRSVSHGEALASLLAAKGLKTHLAPHRGMSLKEMALQALLQYICNPGDSRALGVLLHAWINHNPALFRATKPASTSAEGTSAAPTGGELAGETTAAFVEHITEEQARSAGLTLLRSARAMRLSLSQAVTQASAQLFSHIPDQPLVQAVLPDLVQHAVAALTDLRNGVPLASIITTYGLPPQANSEASSTSAEASSRFLATLAADFDGAYPPDKGMARLEKLTALLPVISQNRDVFLPPEDSLELITLASCKSVLKHTVVLTGPNDKARAEYRMRFLAASIATNTLIVSTWPQNPRPPTTA
jgi:superfamily I DNA/RNA helicase